MEGKMSVERHQADLAGIVKAFRSAKKTVVQKPDVERQEEEIAQLRREVEELKRRTEEFARNATEGIEQIREALTRLVPLIEALVIEKTKNRKGRWFG